jgi:hypothetical protein
MHCAVYQSIDEISPDRIAPLQGSPIDFSYGLLRALERSLWGDLKIRYLSIEEGGRVLAFIPVNIGTNIAFTAAMPVLVQTVYPALVDRLGLAAAYKIAVAGSLVSDRGFIPLHPDCDHAAVIDLMIRGIDALAREEKVQVCFMKDLHQDFPGRVRVRAAGFVECYSLPTVRIDTHFKSSDDYIQSLSPNGRSHARRTLRKVGKNFTLRVVKDFASLIPDVYPLFRATYMKAQFKLEELPPQFFVECGRAHPPSSEMVLCEKGSRIVGAYLVLYNAEQQLNKRIGIDYTEEESPVIYNVLNYYCIIRAIERGIPLSYLGQTTYTPKVRMGGRLEDQFIYVKGYDLGARLSLPLQRAWMNRYRAEQVHKQMEASAALARAPA